MFLGFKIWAHGTLHVLWIFENYFMVWNLSRGVPKVFRTPGNPLIHLSHSIFNSKSHFSKVSFFIQLPIELLIVLPIVLPIARVIPSEDYSTCYSVAYCLLGSQAAIEAGSWARPFLVWLGVELGWRGGAGGFGRGAWVVGGGFEKIKNYPYQCDSGQ